MSATIAALLKRLAVLVVTDKKVRKVVLGIILSVFVVLLLPVMAVVAIFSGGIEVDVGELQDMIVANLSTGNARTCCLAERSYRDLHWKWRSYPCINYDTRCNQDTVRGR